MLGMLVESNLYVFLYGHISEQPDILEGAGCAFPVDSIGLHTSDGLAGEQHLSFGRLVYAG
ncbi:hypothetical protein D3C71_2024450 [compost metagenome]